MRPTSYFTATVLGLALVLGARPVHAETTNCTPITAVPTSITAPGSYCFTTNLTTNIMTGTAIFIQANNVVLDLNGFRLFGNAGRKTQAFGIAAVSQKNITIKNGTIGGFEKGIYLIDNGGSEGHVVEDIRADHNTLTGIHVEGGSNIIRNNHVIATGGAKCCGTGIAAVGIEAHGTEPRVINNDVTDTTSPGDVASRGIRFTQTVRGLAVNNRITNANDANETIEFDLGSTGKYRDNLTFGGSTDGGTDAGNND